MIHQRGSDQDGAERPKADADQGAKGRCRHHLESDGHGNDTGWGADGFQKGDDHHFIGGVGANRPGNPRPSHEHHAQSDKQQQHLRHG